MIRVLSISVYRAHTNEKIYYESFRDKQFVNNQRIRQWIASLEIEYSETFKEKVMIYPIQRMKPDHQIDMHSVLLNTCLVMGQHIDDVISSSRKRELVDVRKAACMILFDMDYTPMDIEKQLPFKNRIIYSYRTKMEDRISTERGFEDEYNEIKNKVLKLTTGINDD